MIKVEELNWNESVYAMTTYDFNVRNQLREINQAGQTRSFAYDGYGRLIQRITPEQGNSTYSYLADDSLQTMTDARGASTTFGYNNRGLVTSITYGVSGDVAATPNVSFGYDSAGNRTSMIDGLGSVSYVYNTLSQLTSETRTFTNVGSYTLSYGYNLAGQLNSITNPWSAQVGYSYDKIGRPTNVSGSGYSGISSYVNSIAYRAFGLKQMAYNNGRTLSLQYDNRLRVKQWNIPSVMGWNYFYNYFGENTGRVTYAQNINDATLDRSYHYDHVGRLQSAFTGSSARAHVGVGSNWLSDGPYAAENNVYDVWGNTLSRTGWGGTNPQYGASYADNKMNGMQYDDAGNLEDAGGGWTFTYDATGQQASSAVGNVEMFYDGDRLRGKKKENGVVTNYYLRSSVLGGQVVAELSSAGAWTRGYVYLGGETLAVQQGGVYWMHQDPVAKSKRVTNASGTVVSTIELDPWGGETNRSSNEVFQPRKFTTYERDSIGSDDAMHRRYNRWWARFEQPDPYDGSYNMTDPQSFNRYSYVQNDPVNFVDPSGLDDGFTCLPGDTSCVVGSVMIYPERGQRAIGSGGGGSRSGLLETPIEGLTGASIVPQNPIPQPQTDNRTVCDRMADDAQRIANEVVNDFPGATAAWRLQEFNKRFGRLTFGSYFSEGLLGALGTPTSSGRNPIGNRSYQGSSGFPTQFLDSRNPGEDQVHHFGAYFSAGLAGHKLAPDMHRGDDRDAGNMGDVRLADQSRRLGQYFRANPTRLSNVGEMIRRTICNGGDVPK